VESSLILTDPSLGNPMPLISCAARALRKGSPDGIWYWVTSLRDAFLTLKGRLESNPIDAYEVMKPVVESSEPENKTVIWLGFNEEEAEQ